MTIRLRAVAENVRGSNLGRDRRLLGSSIPGRMGKLLEHHVWAHGAHRREQSRLWKKSFMQV